MKIALIRCAVNRLLCFTEMQRIKGKRNSKQCLRSSLGLEEPKLELTLGTYENKTLVQLILTLTLLQWSNLYFTSSMRHESTVGMKSQNPTTKHCSLIYFQVVTVHNTDLFTRSFLMGSNKQLQKIITSIPWTTHTFPTDMIFSKTPHSSLEIPTIMIPPTQEFTIPSVGGGEGKMKIFGVNATNNTCTVYLLQVKIEFRLKLFNLG